MIAPRSVVAALAVGSSFVGAASYDSAAYSQYSDLGAAISSLTAANSAGVSSILSDAFASGSVSDFSAVQSKISDAIASATNTVTTTSDSTSTGSSSSSTITSAPSMGITASKNSTATITSKAQTTVSLFNACSGVNVTCTSLNDLTYYGAVISADKTRTIYALDCAQYGKNATQQCFSSAMTVTQGPSMFGRVDDSGSVPTTVSCDVKTKPLSASCTESFKVPSATAVASGVAPKNSANSTVSGYSFTFNSGQIHFNPLVITKGAEKLNGNGGLATNTPTGPSSSLSAPSATSSSGAGSLSAPLAGVGAILFAALAL